MMFSSLLTSSHSAQPVLSLSIVHSSPPSELLPLLLPRLVRWRLSARLSCLCAPVRASGPSPLDDSSDDCFRFSWMFLSLPLLPHSFSPSRSCSLLYRSFLPLPHGPAPRPTVSHTVLALSPGLTLPLWDHFPSMSDLFNFFTPFTLQGFASRRTLLTYPLLYFTIFLFILRGFVFSFNKEDFLKKNSYVN